VRLKVVEPETEIVLARIVFHQRQLRPAHGRSKRPSGSGGAAASARSPAAPAPTPRWPPGAESPCVLVHDVPPCSYAYSAASRINPARAGSAAHPRKPYDSRSCRLPRFARSPRGWTQYSPGMYITRGLRLPAGPSTAASPVVRVRNRKKAEVGWVSTSRNVR